MRRRGGLYAGGSFSSSTASLSMMTKSLLVCIVALFGYSLGEVVVGDEKNFDLLIKENKYVLAEFYAP